MREKTGGRTLGTPNKRAQDIQSRLDNLGCDPIEGMANIAQKALEANDFRLAGQMFKELALHVAPKRKAIEMMVQNNPKQIREMTDEELLALIVREDGNENK